MDTGEGCSLKAKVRRSEPQTRNPEDDYEHEHEHDSGYPIPDYEHDYEHEHDSGYPIPDTRYPIPDYEHEHDSGYPIPPEPLGNGPDSIKMLLSKEASKSFVTAGYPPVYRASFSESSAMRYHLHLLTVAGFLMVFAGLQAETGKKGDTKYVNAPTAQLKADKTASANTVKDLARGTKLKVMDQGDGRWLQVALADNSSVSGWVFFNKLTDDKPKDVQDRLALGGGLKTSDLETGGAIRGLKKASQAYAQKNLNPAERDKASQDIHRIQTFPLTLQDFDKNKNKNLDAAELKLANEEYKRWVQQRLDQFLKEGKLGEYAE